MGQTECENAMDEPISKSKKSRHRKKKLYNSILQQMEFYFSDSNLSKDRFLSQLLAESPFVDLEVFLKFNKILKLTTNLSDIQKAVSSSDLIELSEDKTKISRKKPVTTKANVEECTIYIECIKSDANHEWLKSVFSEFGNVVYVSIPKYKHNKANKGFAFVEFETENEAKSAVSYFESIGNKMPSDTNPEELRSIATFEGDENKTNEVSPMETAEKPEVSDEHLKKRKASVEEEVQDKKFKSDDDGVKNDLNQNSGLVPEVTIQEKDLSKNGETSAVSEVEDGDHVNKKKAKKEQKKKTFMKETGLQVLSKKEWKKMRNRYLDLQKKKMKEFKQYLTRARFSQKTYNEKLKKYKENNSQGNEENKTNEETHVKLDFTPGVIVKLKLPEPCIDVKKLKNEIKLCSNEVKYVDIPLPAGSEEVFIRFGDSQSAKDFCSQEFNGEKTLLENDEEKSYWEKIQNDRTVKFTKCAKKQRGRDKLLKKAEKEMAKHKRFEDEDNN